MKNFSDVWKKQKAVIWLSLLSFIIVSVTGMLIQVVYHMKGFPDEFVYIGLNKQKWLLLHKYTSFIVTILLLVHIARYHMWFVNMIKRKVLSNKNYYIKIMITLLTISFITIITGVFSLLFKPSGDIHNLVIEIHDKFGVVFVIFIIYHVIYRKKRLLKMKIF